MAPLNYYIFLYFLSSITFSQQQTYTLDAVDTAPVVTACFEPKDTKECFIQSIGDYVQGNLVTPATVKGEGSVYAQFVITQLGDIEDIRVEATNEDLKQEVKKVLSILKIEQPAILNGKEVALQYSMPVLFKRNTYDSYTAYFESLAGGLPHISGTSSPPLYEQCDPGFNSRQCFITSTEEQLKKGVNGARPGAVLNYYFEIDQHAQVGDVRVLSHNDQNARKQAAAFLKTLSFTAPAKDEAGKPVSSYYIGRLVF